MAAGGEEELQKKVQGLLDAGFKAEADDEECDVTSFKLLAEGDERVPIYDRDIDDTVEGGRYMSCKLDNDEDHDYILQLQGDELKTISRECKIMYEPLPPTCIVEYCFEDDVWRLSHVSEDACTHYIGSKFKNWEEMMHKPTCEAALRRMVEIGLITTIFDHLAFPNPPVPDGEEDPWIAKTKSGKEVNIPHPVKSLRIWDPENSSYRTLEGRLGGAPAPDDEESYWQEMLTYLRAHFPDEMERIEGNAPAEN